MSLESALSEIIGTGCGNIRFSRYSASTSHVGSEYTHGVIYCDLSFTTQKQLEEQSYGSLRIGQMTCHYNSQASASEYTYNALLVKGENTSKIAEAIAVELFWKD